MRRSDSGIERDVPSKATIFCPDCDHRSRFDGDWAVVDTFRGTRYLCPECGTTVPAGSTLATSLDGVRPLEWVPCLLWWPCHVGIRASRRLWTYQRKIRDRSTNPRGGAE